MASRSSHFNSSLPGIIVSGWGAHRFFKWDPDVTPADVTVRFDAARSCEGAPRIDLSIDLTLDAARKLAAALIAAADKAETFPLTHEYDDGPTGERLCVYCGKGFGPNQDEKPQPGGTVAHPACDEEALAASDHPEVA